MDRRTTASTLFWPHFLKVAEENPRRIPWSLLAARAAAAICCKNAENGWNTSGRTNKNAEDGNEPASSPLIRFVWPRDNRAFRKSINNLAENAWSSCAIIHRENRKQEKTISTRGNRKREGERAGKIFRCTNCNTRAKRDSPPAFINLRVFSKLQQCSPNRRGERNV